MSTLKVNKIEATGTTDGGIEIDSDGHVQIDGIQLPTTGALSNRNLIDNGDLRVAQRGAGPVTHTADGEFLLDRFRAYSSSHNTYSIDHSQSTDVPSGQGFKYSYKYEVSANAAATPANGYVVIGQRIEGYNMDQLHYGTANAKTVTVSFWVKSSEAGTYTSTIRNGNFDFCQTREFSIQNDDTWEFKEITFPGPTTGTWLDATSTGLEVLISIDVGSNFHNASLNTWASNNNFGSSGATNTWSDTLNNEFYVTGLQLEVGSVATPFEHRSYGDELARCQRYYFNTWNAKGLSNAGSGANTYMGVRGRVADVTGLQGQRVYLPTRMRDEPSITIFRADGSTGTSGECQLRAFDEASFTTTTAVSAQERTQTDFRWWHYTGTSVGSSGESIEIACHFQASAEI